MSKHPTLVLVLGFIAGCGAAMVAPLVIPPAHAQTTQRWEVFCTARFQIAGNQEYADRMAAEGNAAGREGWEPFGFPTNGGMCFKRAAP